MKVILKTGFEPIEVGSFLKNSQLLKGAQLVKARHISSLQEIKDGGVIEITASVVPQMKVWEKDYSIKIQVSKSRRIESAKCSCKAGIVGHCKHVAAVLVFINSYKDSSCTNESQKWHAPKSVRVKEYSRGKLAEEMIPANPSPMIYKAKSLTEIVSQFQGLNNALYPTLEAEKLEGIVESDSESEPEEEASDEANLGVLQSVFSGMDQTPVYGTVGASEKLKLTDDALRSFYEIHVKKTRSEAIQLCITTSKQSKDPSRKWHRERKLRITQSQTSHRIKTRRANFEKLADNIIADSFKGNSATRYGNAMEDGGRSSYEVLHGRTVVQLGLVVSHVMPWMAASPDGITLVDGVWRLVEIKCPFSKKNKPILDIQNQSTFPDYLTQEDGKIVLKTKHQYYSQIQFSLFVLNLTVCDFVVHSSVETIVVEGNMYKYCFDWA